MTVREIVGRSKVDGVLYERRDAIAAELVQSIQSQLDRLDAGVSIKNVNLQNVQVPEQVPADVGQVRRRLDLGQPLLHAVLTEIALAGGGAILLMIVLLLALITLMGLCMAWWWPERTEWHYLVVTQLIPLCYAALAWWVARRRPAEGDRD